ncbi:MAG: DNA alkylation repair protein [Thermoplasmata archaeon]|nr:DNA alkylation repair protein [Thermoplasmata archaeon]
MRQEKTGKMKLTKTTMLNSIGNEVGKLSAKKGWNEKAMMELWKRGGREGRLIVIAALQKLSRAEYGKVKKFALDTMDDISDWEICDQMALRVVSNLALIDENEIFSMLKKETNSKNVWRRRRLAAATLPAYIITRKEESRKCLDLLDGLMKDESMDVKKAVAWALREITKKDEESVFHILKKWAEESDRNIAYMLRNGMKKLSEEKQKTIKELLEQSR